MAYDNDEAETSLITWTNGVWDHSFNLTSVKPTFVVPPHKIVITHLEITKVKLGMICLPNTFIYIPLSLKLKLPSDFQWS